MIYSFLLMFYVSWAVQSYRFGVRSSNFRPGVRLLSTLTESRLEANGKSLDVNLLSTEPELVNSHMKSRRASESIFADVAKISVLRNKRNAFIQQGDAAKSERKTLSKEIGKLMKDGLKDEAEEMKKRVAEASDISAKADTELEKIDAEIFSIISCIPNLIDDGVPDGADESQNEVVKVWGADTRKIGEDGTYSWHDDIAQKLGGLDVAAAGRISGARFSILTGSIARLERAITQFFLDFHTSRGYTEVSIPYIVSRSTLEGTGQLPKFEDDLFKVSHSVAGEDAFLIPTAEVPVTNMLRNQLIDAADLPFHYVCASPSFRAEAGSYGRDTKGLLRQHQFHKVEMVKIVAPTASEEEHQQMVADAEAILEALKIPYRTVLLCSGDMGFSARKCYDIEAWLPGQQEYREISSISNCHDFQSRRMGLRYRQSPQGSDKKKKEMGTKTAFPHTLNGSGIAVGRALVAILENYQEADGSVNIPEVLRPYMGGLEKLSPP